MSSQVAKGDLKYSELFHAIAQRRGALGAPWLNRLRESAMDRFDHLGFPKPTEEDWKYTNVAAISREKFRPVEEDTARTSIYYSDAVAPFIYEESINSQLVFVDGVYQSSLSSIAAIPEVTALDLSEALNSEEYSGIVRTRLGRTVDYNVQAFTALNTAFFRSGAFIVIPKGARLAAPIHLLFISSSGNESANVSFPRVLVIAEAHSEAAIIETYVDLEGGKYWTNAVEEFALDEGARIEVYRIQNESRDAFHIATTGASLSRSATFASTAITLGSRLSRHDIGVSLQGEGAECVVDGLYIVGQDQHADTHSLIDHLQPRCTSRQLYKGILNGKSRAVFNGKVIVHEGAQQTDAMQTNRNLLLSPDARVDTKPQLEIFADDVKCAHGATVGQLEDEELFYFASRGMHPEMARNLLTYGFAEEVIKKIKVDSIKARLDETVLNRLHARLEV